MPLLARIVFGLCGAALALYAAASLSGNWLSTPPWWEREMPSAEENEAVVEDAYLRHGWVPKSPEEPSREAVIRDALAAAAAKEGREAISIGVGAVGLTLAGFAVLGRRRSELR